MPFPYSLSSGRETALPCPLLSSEMETAMPFPYSHFQLATSGEPVAGKIASWGQIRAIANTQFAPVVGAFLALPSV